MKLSIVLPAHNEGAVIAQLHDRLVRMLDQLPDETEAEIVFVDDGSTDDTWRRVCELAGGDDRVYGVRLSRNFGHQMALTAGLQVARGDAVITMDSDLQHPPEVIPALLEAAAARQADIVYAVRSEVDAEGWFKVASAKVFYWLLNKLTSLDLPNGGADFRYMSRRTVDALLAMPERNRFLRGMTRWIGFEQTVIEYDRGPRIDGRSKYTIRHMIHFAMDGIAGFSALPLRLASLLGFAVSALGFVYLVYVLVIRLAGHALAGWTSVIVAVLLLGGVQLICMGIIGQYLGRMYDETKRRPLYLIADDTRNATGPQPERPLIASSIGDPDRRPL